MFGVSEAERIFLGVHASSRAVAVEASNGGRTSITAERLSAPADWVELTTYGLRLPTPSTVYACVAVPSGTSKEDRQALVRAGRDAGWDAVLVVNALRAAAQGLQRSDLQALLVVDSGRSSVGLCAGARLQNHDHVNQIPGREARELAVSLRILLKARSREERRELLRHLVVLGDSEEVSRIGQRQLAAELEQLGVRGVEFELDPYLIARGAQRIASSTERIHWRRLRRSQRG